MQFRVLGPLEARTSHDGPVWLCAAKQRTLLAVLLLHANHAVSGDRLMTALWPGQPPRSAAGLVRTYVSALRHGLRLTGEERTPRLIARPGGYRLDLDSADLDVLLFDDLAARGRRALADGEPARAARLLAGALALWRGNALEDVAVDVESENLACRLEERRMAAEEACTDAQLAQGNDTDLADLIARIRGLIAKEPLRERLWGQLMLALYRAGRQAEALAAFRDLRRRMADELGITPGLPLQRLQCQILAGDAALGRPPSRALLAAASVVPRQLPREPGGFTGRARELAEIGALAGKSAEAVTVCAISGTAGMGKTALALHAGHRLAERFPDGQLYVNLRGSTAGQPLPASEALAGFLRALGVDLACCPPDLDGRAAMYRSLLAGRRALVLIDDAASASQVRPLIPGTPRCVVLVTSRGRLGGLVAGDGAHPITLDSLATGEAVTLLANIVGADRVRAERDAAEQIAQACGGMPLALRIAAARLVAQPGWPIRELAGRLRQPAGRLDELEVEELGIRSTLRTARQVLCASARPADATAAQVFPLLSLLDRGDLSLAAAARLLGQPERETERILGSLVDARLIDSPVPGRYRMHDLVRLCAREQAAQEYSADARTAAVTRALDWYAATERDAV